MPFRSAIAVIAALVLGVIGCSGENEFSSQPPKVKFDSPKFACLKEFDTNVGRFLDGVLPNSEVQLFWNCLDLAIVQFVKYVRGGDGQNYTPRELADFVDTFFLDNRGLVNESELLAELMEIKKLFVGGSTNYVSHHDLFVRTRQLIQEFKSIALELNPHMKILHDGLASSTKKGTFVEPEVHAALEALNTAGLRLGALIRDGQHFYSFSHLLAFVNRLEAFLQIGDPEFSFGNAKKYLPLFSEFKGFLVSQPYDLIRSEDWTRLFQMLTSVMGWALEYRNYVEEQNWRQGRPLKILNQIITEAFAAIDGGLQAQPGKEYSYLDLDRLMDRLDDMDLLPLDISGETMKDSIRGLAEKLLDTSSEDKGFSRGDLSSLKAELDRWFETQYYIENMLSGGAPPSVSGGAQEMENITRPLNPMVIDEAGRLMFADRAQSQAYDLRSLSALNWQRAIIRLLMRGYAVQASPDGAKGLTKTQFIQLAKDWHVLAEQLGLFDPGEAESMAKKIFMESNLFMPSANGDSLLDFAEGVQYLAYGISGLNASGEIRDYLAGRCAAPEAPKLFDAVCLRQSLIGERNFHFLPLAQLLKDMDSSTNERFTKFLKNVELTTRDGIKDTPFSRGEVIEMIVLMQYIETFFAIYDGNQNQRINVDETLRAFPVYRQSLDEIVKGSYGLDMGNDDLLALFTYFFKYGKPPQSSLGGMVKFLNWKWRPDKWKYEEDRIRVSEILAELNAQR